MLAALLLVADSRGVLFVMLSKLGKLGRQFIAIESDEEYCLLAAKRLEMAETDKSIQGFEDGVFWERNSKRPKQRP